jgi:hypothetical protein
MTIPYICNICGRMIHEEIEGKNKVIYITEQGTKEVCFDCDRKEEAKKYNLNK